MTASSAFGLGQSPATTLGLPVKVCDLTVGAVIAYADRGDARVIVTGVTPPDVNESLWAVSVAAPNGLPGGYLFSAEATVRVLYNGADRMTAECVAEFGAGPEAEAAVIKAALALQQAPATGIAHCDASRALNKALVACNGAPLAYRGRLNPDGPAYPRPAPAPGADPARAWMIGDAVAGVWFGRHGCGLTADPARAFRYTLAEAKAALAASGDRDRYRIMAADAPDLAHLDRGVQPDPAAAALVTEAAAIGEHLVGEAADAWEREAADLDAAADRRATGNAPWDEPAASPASPPWIAAGRAALRRLGFRLRTVRNGWCVVTGPGYESGKMSDGERAWAVAIQDNSARLDPNDAPQPEA